MVGTGIIWLFKFVVDKIISLFQWLYDKLVGHSIIPDIVKAMIKWFWKLPGAILSALSSIMNSVYQWGIDFIGNIVKGIKSTGRKIIDAILNLFPAWMRNSIESSGSIVINIVKTITEKIRGALGGKRDDFIWRPGQGAISINPKDTLVGFKGAPPNFGGKKDITINQTNYINISDKEEIEKLIRDNNLNLIEEIKRQIAI